MKHSCQEGVLQVATGDRHRNEAIASVQRIRPYLNGRPITLVTDNPNLVPKGLFDRIITHNQSQKVIAIRSCRFCVFPISEHYFLIPILRFCRQLRIFSASEKL